MDRLQRALGVTRVARVTGLDRAGIQVACAVRPGGHVLQISNGKGESWAQARASALSEAAELWAAERPPAELYWGSARELVQAGYRLTNPAGGHGQVLVAPRLWSRETRIAWVRALELSDAEVLVPAQAVFCPPRGSTPLGPAVFRWSTNGMGAHPRRELAVRHALLEALERDQLARALPHGWTPRAIATRKLDVSGNALWRQLRDARLEAHVFDLSGALPVAGAVLVDLDAGPVPLTAGYAAGWTPQEAVRGALLEAAQSRLTDVHGAREDVAPRADGETRGMAEACARSRPMRSLGEMPALAAGSGAPRANAQSVRGVHNLQMAGLVRLVLALSPRAALVDLASAPLHVVKVVAPGLRLSELL